MLDQFWLRTQLRIRPVGLGHHRVARVGLADIDSHLADSAGDARGVLDGLLVDIDLLGHLHDLGDADILRADRDPAALARTATRHSREMIETTAAARVGAIDSRFV